MKITNRQLLGLAAAALMLPAAMSAKTTPVRSMEDTIRHELIVGVPQLSVFDDVSFQFDAGSRTVTLSGAVTQPFLKDSAARSVKHIEGVAHVNNQIEVLPLSRFDDQIRMATFRRLARSMPVERYFVGPNPPIRIIVKNGNVMLDGVVANSGDRQIAFMAANSIPGVFSVTNNLRIERFAR